MSVRLPTELKELDEQLGGGLLCGTTTCLLGAPGSGMTTLLLDLAGSLMCRGFSVAFASVAVEQMRALDRMLGLVGKANRRDVLAAAIRHHGNTMLAKQFAHGTRTSDVCGWYERMLTYAPGPILLLDGIGDFYPKEDGRRTDLVARTAWAPLRRLAERHDTWVVATTQVRRHIQLLPHTMSYVYTDVVATFDVAHIPAFAVLKRR